MMKYRRKCTRLLYELKEYNRRGCDFGDVKLCSGSWLYRQIMKCSPKSVVVEIGTLRGQSTFWMDRAAVKRNISVYTIDTWSGTSPDSHHQEKEFRKRGGYKKVFLNNKKIAQMNNTNSICGYSWEIGEMLKTIDFVYIDGDHNNVLRDVVTFFPKLKDNHIFSGHDWSHAPKYQHGWPMVTLALTAVFGDRIDVEIGDFVWAVTKGKKEIELFEFFMKNTVRPIEEKFGVEFNEIDVLDYIDDINVIIPPAISRKNIR